MSSDQHLVLGLSFADPEMGTFEHRGFVICRNTFSSARFPPGKPRLVPREELVPATPMSSGISKAQVALIHLFAEASCHVQSMQQRGREEAPQGLRSLQPRISGRKK